MGDLIVTTYDWVPAFPRGFVRDLRVRWALEEAGLPYRVATTPLRDRGPAHFAHQPFGQVPWLQDGDLSIFESGAILLHLGAKSPVLMPADPAGRSAVTSWSLAALNSVEMAVMPLLIYRMVQDETSSPGRVRLDRLLESRLRNLEPVLAAQEWLAGAFSVADILMADVLRMAGRLDVLGSYPACSAYVARATGRPAFRKALDDQMAHFAAADARADAAAAGGAATGAGGGAA